MISIYRSVIRTFVIFILAVGPAFAAADLPLESIKLPPGFKIELYATKVFNARQMALSPNGTVFVGSRENGDGRVHAVVDKDKDGKADEVTVIAKKLVQPSGVAFHDGALYVAEIHRVIKFENIEETYASQPAPVVVNDSYPDKTHHGWKFIAFGPDGKLYVPVGVPCNVCEPEDEIFGTITRLDADGSGREIFARGVRNSVGFDWHPVTKELWFTDNGRDLMGDGVPPDELNRAPKAGMHFGFPYIHGSAIPDPTFGKGHKPEEFTPPAQNLDPHVAAIGMRFYTGTAFPEEYRNQIFIAEHGSWNRTPQAGHTGFRVVCVKLDADSNVVSYEPFAHGWLQNNKAWGRPADVLNMPDGSMLVSDDAANCIYRIRYTG
ncbi:MAG: PQQ-dependent sugar dehydrogenase [Candidatus Hydrogenedentes bacterium]|nr:PQQ-dependent sugar dehydrogenase [Candidatus Hydrogenedentota bacterium]